MTKNERVNKLAKRIYDITAPWDRDDETADDISRDINEDPCSVIEYLLDMLEGN